MRIQHYIPKHSNDFIHLIWEQYSNEKSSWKILPSGYVELIFRISTNFAVDNNRSYLKKTEATGNFCFLSGLHTKPLYFSFNKFHFIGIQLNPIAVKALFGIPTNELRNNAIEGEAIVKSLNKIEDILKSERTFYKKAIFLENFIYSKINESNDLHMAVRLSRLVKKLTHHKILGEKIDLESCLGYSRTHSFRIFNEWFGHSSVNTLKLLQFAQTINHLHSSTGRLNEAALQNGYFDQSHFIRSFKEFAEMTPGTYKKKMTNIPGQISY